MGLEVSGWQRKTEAYKTCGNIEFKNVYFSYKEDREILQDINLSAEAGEKIALVEPDRCSEKQPYQTS